MGLGTGAVAGAVADRSSEKRDDYLVVKVSATANQPLAEGLNTHS